jgi:hypothetical protein
VRDLPNGRTALEATGPGRPPSAADRVAPDALPAAPFAEPVATGAGRSFDAD